MVVAVETGASDHHVGTARRQRGVRVDLHRPDPRQEPNALARPAAADAPGEAHRVLGGHVDQIELVVELEH